MRDFSEIFFPTTKSKPIYYTQLTLNQEMRDGENISLNFLAMQNDKYLIMKIMIIISY